MLNCRYLRISPVSLPQAFDVRLAQQLHSDTDTDGGSDIDYGSPDDSAQVIHMCIFPTSGLDGLPPDDGNVSRDPNVEGFVPAFLVGNVHMCKLPRRYVAKSWHHIYTLCSPSINLACMLHTLRHLPCKLTAYSHMPLQDRCPLNQSLHLLQWACASLPFGNVHMLPDNTTIVPLYLSYQP